MILIYTALLIHRFNTFISAQSDITFLQADGESAMSFVTRIDNLYFFLIKEWEQTEDGPSRVCTLFMKEVESCMRCRNRVKE